MMDGRRVKVLLLRFQFICTKTIRRLDPLRVNIVNNKRTASSCDSAARMRDVLFRVRGRLERKWGREIKCKKKE